MSCNFRCLVSRFSQKCSKDLRLSGRQPTHPFLPLGVPDEGGLETTPLLGDISSLLESVDGGGSVVCIVSGSAIVTGDMASLVTQTRLTYQQEGALRDKWILDAAAVVLRVHSRCVLAISWVDRYEG